MSDWNPQWIYIHCGLIFLGNFDDYIGNFFIVSIYLQKLNEIVLFYILSSEEPIGLIGPYSSATFQTHIFSVEEE